MERGEAERRGVLAELEVREVRKRAVILIAAARKYNRIVQQGSQSRSSPALQEAVKRMRDGEFGEVYMSRGLCFKWRDTIGKTPVSAVPAGVDYDLSRLFVIGSGGAILSPGGKTILPAAYEGLSKGSWSDLVKSIPMAARYMDVLYRTYGWYNVAFGVTTTLIAVTAFRRGERWAWWALLVGNTITLVSAIRYDWVVNAIGPFEVSEYLGLALVWGALAVTVPSVSLGAIRAWRRGGVGARL